MYGVFIGLASSILNFFKSSFTYLVWCMYMPSSIFYYLPVSLLCYIFLFSMKVFLKFERACNLLITDNYSFIVFVLLWYYTFIVQNLWSTKFSFFCNIQSDDEREMCARTVYCTNIDKKVYLLEKLKNIFLVKLFNLEMVLSIDLICCL